MNCSKLTAGLVGADCKSVIAGVEEEVILINFEDIDKSDAESIDGNVIKKITLKGDAKGCIFTSYGKSFDEAGATFTKGTYRNSWSHSVPLRIFVKDEQAKDFVNKFGAGARVVAILENKEGGETKYEAYGWDNGLELSEATSTVAMADGIVYGMTIASSETAQENSLPKSVTADLNSILS